LSNTNLRKANLRNANLYNASLRDANLYNANLYNADLCDANLRNANLRDASLRNVGLCLCGHWTIQIHSEKTLSIGCKRKSIAEWNKFFKSKEIIETKRGTSEFKEIELNFEYAKMFIKKYKGQFEEQEQKSK